MEWWSGQHSNTPILPPLLFLSLSAIILSVKVVTAEMMRELDRRAVEECAIPGVVLMENAGRAVFDLIAERYGPVRGAPFRVLCGVGNNGGDGFVVARHLHLAGAHVTLNVAGDPEKIKGDARIDFDLMVRLGVRPQAALPSAGIKIDALLGTGLKDAPRGVYAEAIRWMNVDGAPTVAVDIPSGVDSDTGATPGEAVRAAATVTFGYPKLGLFLSPGADCTGDLIVRDIGFDWEALRCETEFGWIRAEDLRDLIPSGPRDAHKGQFGHVLVLGGSIGMSGAPAMTARAALRSGAGLVTVVAPSTVQKVIAAKLDEAMTLPVEEKDGAFCAQSFETVRRAAERCDVLCVGPGATQNPEAQDLMVRVLREIDKPGVVDADGLNALACRSDELMNRKTPLVMTPHPGECARLLGSSADAIQSDRIGAVRSAAGRYRAVVVLKGAGSLIADGRKAGAVPIRINTTGNPGMASGGSGDSLTGIIGALLGQGLDAFDAACAGTYLHGRSGDIAAAEKGQIGMIAGDIIESIPRAFRELEEIA